MALALADIPLATSAESRVLRLGLMPVYGIRTLMSRYEPMRAYIARTLGREGLFQMLARPEPLAHGVKTIALHALMHADDFDIARVMRCPIAHATPTESVPVCARRALAPPGADS